MPSSKINHKTFDSYDVKTVKFNGIRASESGMRFCNLQNSSGDRLIVETPAMRIPWTTEVRASRDNGSLSAKLALSFQGMDGPTGGRVDVFKKFLEKLDQRVKTLLKENKGDLWSKNMDENKINAVYQDSVKESNNDKYAPTFQMKIGLEDNPSPASDSPNDLKKMKITVFDVNRKALSTSELQGGCMASAIVEASYVWVGPMMCGITWNVKSVLVKPKEKEEEFQFTETDEFGEAEETPKRKRESDEEGDSSKRSSTAEDSSDGEDLEDEEDTFED